MIMTDPIADMLTRIRNGLQAVTQQLKCLQARKRRRSPRS